MATYFAIIPVEVLTLIFIKIEEPGHLEKLLGTDFDAVLSSAVAWKLKINAYLQDITWELIPKSLLDYQNNEPIKCLFIYNRLYWVWYSTITEYADIIEKERAITVNLTAINNLDVLTLKYTKRVSIDIEKNIYKMCEVFEQWYAIFRRRFSRYIYD